MLRRVKHGGEQQFPKIFKKIYTNELNGLKNGGCYSMLEM